MSIRLRATTEPLRCRVLQLGPGMLLVMFHNLPRMMRRLLCFNEPVCGGVYSPLAVLLRPFGGTSLTYGASGSYGDFYRAFRHGDEC